MADTRREEQTRRFLSLVGGRLAQHRWMLAAGAVAVLAVGFATGAPMTTAAAAIRPSLPILLASGYADLPTGTTTTLPRVSKPFDETELRAQIASLIDGP